MGTCYVQGILTERARTHARTIFSFNHKYMRSIFMGFTRLWGSV